MDLLEERIRRSSRLKEACSFREFLTYACLVSDEDEVYSFMEQNKIGIYQPEFWAAKLTMLKNKCEYKEFLKVLKQLIKNQQLKKHPKYWLIEQISKQLQKHLQHLLRSKVRSKRSGRQYQLLNFDNVEKQTHKFGRIEVYVDPDCRMQYRLQDLIDFVMERLSGQCEVEKNCYHRQMSKKPVSFLGKEKQKIEKLSLQMFGIRNRNTSGRISVVGRKSNKPEGEIHTPDKKKKSINKQNGSTPHRNQLNEISSIQYLKHQSRRSIINSQKSLKQVSQHNPESYIHERSPSIKKEKIRKWSQQSQQIFSESDMDHSSENIFQLETDCKNYQNCQDGINRQQSIISHYLQRDTDEVENKNDIAFIQQTEHEVDVIGCSITVKPSIELQNVIKQIQMQKYESQTYSEIDSNKQNNMLSREEEIVNVNSNGLGNGIDIPCLKEERRIKFGTLKKGKNRGKDEDRRREDGLSFADGDVSQSSIMEYKNLLQYLGEHKEKKEKQEYERLSMSTKESKKRISRISEERSYSYSETKPSSSRGGEVL